MKSILHRIFLAAFLFTSAISLAQAATYYVSSTGSDSNPGSLSAPFLTIQKAADTVVAGDVIEVMGGNYDGFRVGKVAGHLGTASSWIHIRPYQGAAVRIGPNNPNSSEGTIAFRPVHCDAMNPSTCPPAYWIVEGFEIVGGASYYAVKFETGYARLLNNKIHTSGNDLVKLVRFADQVEIRGNELHNQGASGGNQQAIDIVGANDTYIGYNHVHDINSIGIYAKGNARNTVIEHNRVENVTDRAIMLGQNVNPVELMRESSGPRYESYDGIVRNNVIINSGGACLATASSLNPRIYNNTCYNAGYSTNHAAIFVSNESQLGTAGRNVYIQNNIIHETQAVRRAVKIGPNAMEDDRTLFINYNVYHNPNGPVAFMWDRAGGEGRPFFEGNLAQWRAYTAQNGLEQDTNSIEADPSFQETTDLRINTNSPAVNAGTGNGPATLCAANDYREQDTRPQQGVCDIGADEVAGAGDTTPPTATMTAPANGSTVSGVITVSAQADDNVGVAGVQFLVDGNPIGAEDTSNPYQITYDTSTLAAGSHTFSARARDAAGNIGNATPVTVTVQGSNPPQNCIHADPGQWQNTAFASQTGTFTATWDAKPLANNIDSLHALSLGPQTNWTGLAAIVRFNATGTIDARNGSGYAAGASVPYSANNLYRIRAVVNVTTKRYSVYVTAPGGTEQLLAQNYAFRTEQQGVTSLDNFVVQAEVGASEACGFTVTPGGGSTETGETVRWENNNSNLTYAPIGTGHWSLNGSSQYASGGNFAVGNGAGAVLTFSFTGTAVKWLSLMDQYSGQARVTLDGVSETVDLYRPSGAADFGWQKVAWQKSGLTYGTHNVKIEVLGTKNASSGGVGVGVDAFDITE